MALAWSLEHIWEREEKKYQLYHKWASDMAMKGKLDFYRKFKNSLRTRFVFVWNENHKKSISNNGAGIPVCYVLHSQYHITILHKHNASFRQQHTNLIMIKYGNLRAACILLILRVTNALNVSTTHRQRVLWFCWCCCKSALTQNVDTIYCNLQFSTKQHFTLHFSCLCFFSSRPVQFMQSLCIRSSYCSI